MISKLALFINAFEKTIEKLGVGSGFEGCVVGKRDRLKSEKTRQKQKQESRFVTRDKITSVSVKRRLREVREKRPLIIERIVDGVGLGVGVGVGKG